MLLSTPRFTISSQLPRSGFQEGSSQLVPPPPCLCLCLFLLLLRPPQIVPEVGRFSSSLGRFDHVLAIDFFLWFPDLLVVLSELPIS
ncbi:hypothetical protein C4D60_Mb04t39520 [Musa balbisiana]|uniref:Uncharacterized protein n=1 Tax=Musa balbisiana TaxID=52838 RepID=A0A4S8KI04_MUSBA|nr:hypothetical protein C4D60_Mb04t39520 [Musa balbisiana]